VNSLLSAGERVLEKEDPRTILSLLTYSSGRTSIQCGRKGKLFPRRGIERLFIPSVKGRGEGTA